MNEQKQKVGIVGSRNYKNTRQIRIVINELPNLYNLVIVSGGARGVDKIAEQEAKELKLETLIFEPEIQANCSKVEYAIAAFKRNTKIAETCDYLIAFWDGSSNGTLDTIRKATKLGKKVIIYGDTNG